jgi:hypothetical protein
MKRLNPVQQLCFFYVLVGLILAVMMTVANTIVTNFFVWFITMFLLVFSMGFTVAAALLMRASRNFHVVE